MFFRKKVDTQALCERCLERKLSRERVERWRSSGAARPGGLVADPAPHAECKRHEGYGHDVESRDECRDFVPVEEKRP